MTLVTNGNDQQEADNFSSVLNELCDFQHYFKDKDKSADLVEWVKDELNCSKVTARFLVRKIAPFALTRIQKSAGDLGQSWLNKLHEKLSEFAKYRMLASSLLDILKSQTDKSFAHAMEIPSEQNLQNLIDSPQRYSNLKDTQKAMLRLMLGQKTASAHLKVIQNTLADIEALFQFNIDLETVEDIQTKAINAEIGQALWLTYARQQCPLVGRDRELAALQGFYNSDKPFEWWAITGSGGLGKSRLALDSIQQQAHLWYAGFLSEEKLTVDDALSNWLPNQPTIIVIDYAAKNFVKVAAWLKNLHKKQNSFDFAVRVLLLERVYEEQHWWQELTSGSSDSLSLKHSFHNHQLLTPIKLEPLAKNKQKEALKGFLIGLRAEDKLPDTDSPLWEIIDDLTTHGSPLFIGMIAVVLVDPESADLRNWEHKDVLEHIFKHEENAWERSLTKHTEQQKTQIKDLFALSSILGGMSFDNEELLTQQLLSAKLINSEEDLPVYWTALQTLSGDMQGQLQPDLLAEYFILKHWPMEKGQPSALIKKRIELVFRLNSNRCLDFIRRCALDYSGLVSSFYWWEYLYSIHLGDGKKLISDVGFEIVLALNLKGIYPICLTNWLSILERSEDLSCVVRAKNLIGIQFLHLSDYVKALQYFTESLKIGQNMVYNASKGMTLSNISRIYRLQGDFKPALEYLAEALSICRVEGSKIIEATVLNSIAQIYREKEEYQPAFEYFMTALKINKEVGNRQGEAVNLGNIARVYTAWENYDEAIKYLTESVKISEEIGDQNGMAYSLNDRSQIHAASEKHPEAISCLTESIRIFQAIGNRIGEGTALTNLAKSYINLAEPGSLSMYDKALPHLKNAISIQRDINDRPALGISLRFLSRIYSAKTDTSSALESLTESVSIHQSIGDKRGQLLSLEDMWQIYIKSDNYEDAMTPLLESLRLCKDTGDKIRLCSIKFNLGRCYEKKERIHDALNEWIDVYQIATEIQESQVLRPLEKLAKRIGLDDGLLGWQRLLEKREKNKKK